MKPLFFSLWINYSENLRYQVLASRFLDDRSYAVVSNHQKELEDKMREFHGQLPQSERRYVRLFRSRALGTNFTVGSYRSVSKEKAPRGMNGELNIWELYALAEALHQKAYELPLLGVGHIFAFGSCRSESCPVLRIVNGDPVSIRQVSYSENADAYPQVYGAVSCSAGVINAFEASQDRLGIKQLSLG